MQKKFSSKEEIISEIASILKERIKDNNSVQKLAFQAWRGANEGLELDASPIEWLNKRFRYQFVWLDRRITLGP